MKLRKQVIVYYKSETSEGFRMKTVSYWFWQSKSLAIGRKVKEIYDSLQKCTITNIQIF